MHQTAAPKAKHTPTKQERAIKVLTRSVLRRKRMGKGTAYDSVLREIAAARVALGQALGMLESLDEDSLCPRGRASQRARYLRNLLDSVYGQEVQPYLAELDRRQRRLGERLRALRAASSGTNPALDRWLDHYFGPRGQSARLDQALRAHTERWQTVLGACGLMPVLPDLLSLDFDSEQLKRPLA